MAKAKEELEIDDEAGVEEDDGEETSVEVAKTNLTKRRIIDNLLEERRLQRQLSDYDFDLWAAPSTPQASPAIGGASFFRRP